MKACLWRNCFFEAAARGIMPDYTGKLLAAFETQDRLVKVLLLFPRPWLLNPPSNLVLHLPKPVSLSRSASVSLKFCVCSRPSFPGREIAQELVIALSTVRTHTKSIFSKLDVNNRRAAVKRAAELGLI